MSCSDPTSQTIYHIYYDFTANRTLPLIIQSIINFQGCPRVACPALPEGCDDVRRTDVIIKSRLCEQCPACYDETVMSNHDTL